MALIRNEIERIDIPGFGEVPFQVQVDDDGSLSISLPAIIEDDDEESIITAGSCALGLLKRYIEERHIPCRSYHRGSTLAGNVRLDMLILHRGAERATELMAMLQLLVAPIEERP